MKFDYCRKIKDDELLYGYMLNLIRTNMLGPISQVEKELGCQLLPGVYSGIGNLCQTITNTYFPSVEEAVRHTPLGFLIEGKDEGEASKTAEAFVQDQGHGFSSVKIKAPSDYLNVCPDCLKEDGVIHLSHNLPGVEVCTKHHRPLIKISCGSKRTWPNPVNPESGKEYQVNDIASSCEQAEEEVRKNQKGLKLLKRSTCPVCGCTWVETEYSHKTLAGCPVCNQKLSEKEILQRRLNARFPDEYEAQEDNDSLKVFHKPCGQERKDVNSLIYGSPKVCEGCMQLAPESLQRRYDPDEEKWKFLPIPEEERKRKRLTVKCLKCGHIFHPFSPIWSQEQKCPSCESKQERKEISEIDPEYQVVGHYKDNRTPVKIRHLDCGTTFETSKNSFMRGCRCPLCTPRYSYEDVENAVYTYLPDWQIIQGDKRGTAVLTKNGTPSLVLSYQEIMVELKRETSDVFPDKTGIYKEEPNVKRKIYEEIKLATEDKGFWGFSDGLFGEDVDRVTRNLVQDLCKAGYIERIGRGKYMVSKQSMEH